MMQIDILHRVIHFFFLATIGFGCSWTDLEIPDKDPLDTFPPPNESDMSSEKDSGNTDEDVDTDTDADSGTDADSDSDTDSDSDADSDADADADSDSDADIDSETASISESDPDRETESQPESCEASTCDRYLIGGTSGDYSTIGEAVADLSKSTFTNCKVLCLTAGEYFEQVTIPELGGTSSQNNLTIKGMTEDRSLVKITYEGLSGNSDYILKLNGSDHVTFENLTIGTDDETILTAAVLDNDASYNTFKNVHFAMSSLDSSVLVGILGETRGNQLVSNFFEGGGTGIRIWSSTWNVQNIAILNNTFERQIKQGMDIQRADSLWVADNQIRAAENALGFQGIRMVNCSKGWKVENNQVIAERGKGIVIEYSTGTADLPNVIANNFVRIQGKKGDPDQNPILLNNVAFLSIFFNSFVVGTSADVSSAAFFLTATGVEANTCSVMNNIFANLSGGKAVDFDTEQRIVECDYNDLYSTGGILAEYGAQNTPVRNLDEWQTTLGIDLHSVSSDPMFLSDTDYRIGAQALNGAATPIATIETDIEAHPRNQKTPDIGAYELD